MEIEQNDLYSRLESIFNSFLKPNYTPLNGIYFEKLMKHLSAEEQYNILSAPFIFEWIDKCAQLIMVDFKQVHPQVVAFCFNLTSLSMRNEWSLITFKKKNILENLINTFNTNTHHFSPSVKLGAVRLIKAICTYSVGCAIVGAKGSWRHIHIFCIRDHTVYVVHEARQLIFDFIYKYLVKANDEALVAQILEEICRPIHYMVKESNVKDTLIKVDDSEKWKEVLSTIDLLTYVFERIIETKEKLIVLKYCNADTSLSMSVWQITAFTQNVFIYSKILKLLTVLNYAVLLEENWSGGEQIKPDSFNRFGVNFYNTLRWCVTRGECVNFLNCVRYNFKLWRKLGDRVPKDIIVENELLNFAQMLLVFHMIPLLSQHKNTANMEDDVFSKNFIMKIFQIQNEQAVRLCYAYRDICLHDRSNAFMVDLAYRSTNGLVALIPVFNRDEAILVFQALMNALKIVVETISEETNDPNSCVSLVTENVNACYAILVGMESLIQRYRITWKESFESVCLVNFIVMLLKRNMSTRLCVQSLKVIQLSIEHFMAPNMALLIDDLNGSSLSCLGPCILKLVHDPAWEIRDSTLELVNVITQISRIKFPAFQKILIEHGIVPIVFDMSKHDSELYVRASSFKCLASMVAVEKIWEKHMDSNQIFEHLLDVMYNEQEGIVRQEAVKTMSKIYEKRKIPVQYEDKLYSIFIYLIINDLHWEVSVNALHFWKLEILRRCSDQGMIDGTFPTVTFSKEHKKIVQLTPREINVRITKILNELSARGCIAILYKCLTEEMDVSLTTEVIGSVQCLQSMLKKYEFEPIGELVQHDNPAEQLTDHINATDMLMNNCEMVQNEKNSDDVIDVMLKEKDLNYVVEVCKQRLQMNGDTPVNSIDPLFYKNYAYKNTKEFLNMLNTQNLTEILESRQKWLTCSDKFESFIEELWNIFTVIKDDPTFTTDCY